MTTKIKIGIITHYHKSVNYGGNLQAYALCRFLIEHGYNAEQISYDRNKNIAFRKKLRYVVAKIYKNIMDVANRIKHAETYRDILRREHAFIIFRDSTIPHSKIIYTKNTLKNLAKAYDVFITGSDQVWHPQAVCDAYLLDFHVNGVKKISYAASVAQTHLNNEQKERYRAALHDYYAISVREQDTVDLLQSISPVPVNWVVDPVFLLSRQKWDELCEHNIIKKPYVFCYFLGENSIMRRLAREYADKIQCELVIIPYLNGKFRTCDNGYGDIAMYDVSPEKFVTLIKYASCVFTDSFHAMAFSLIMEKEYFVFNRDPSGAMSSRIYSLSLLFGTQARFCNEQKKYSIEYLSNVPQLDYSPCFVDFEQMKKKSADFLLNSIK